MLSSLANESIIEILEFLRATDLINCIETNKNIFTKERISRAIEKVVVSVYSIPEIPRDECIPSTLFSIEIKAILKAINAPAHTKDSGYWISLSWLTNAKLYYEAISLPETSFNKKSSTPNKKVTKIRARRGSDALPPWPLINTDIICSHGCLASTKGVRAKRRVIEKKHWFMLRKFYPQGPSFKSTKQECIECSGSQSLLKSPVEIKSSRYINPESPLFGVFKRKNGVPSHCLTMRDEYEAPLAKFRPLMAGIYHIIPKEWLVRWRQFIKDTSIASPPMFDCGSLLC
jgi:hypothetical protein